MGDARQGLAEALSRQRRRWADFLKRPDRPGKAAPGRPRLVELTGFGSNPGALRMYAYVPATWAPARSLVVVLHGCLQSAAAYDLGAGWSILAERYGFALLFPEQPQRNNPRRCFNWFLPADASRGGGEALSIAQGVERLVSQQGIARDRVFVTGLSAGGAMTSVMLAAYPELFAAGAIIAGLPYGCAWTVGEALEAMAKGRTRSPREWGDLVRAASPHRGPWPRVSIWHGSADTTVHPVNAEEIAKQWSDVHGVASMPNEADTIDGHPRRLWSDGQGTAVIESYTITGMAHGTPLATQAGEDRHGREGPFLLEAGIASSYRIAQFFGIAGQRLAGATPRAGQPTAPPAGPLARVLGALGIRAR